MTNLLVFNNMKHERIVPDDEDTTWGDETQTVIKLQNARLHWTQTTDRPLASQRVTRGCRNTAIEPWPNGFRCLGWDRGCLGGVEAQFIFPGGHEGGGGVPWSMNQGCVHVRLGHTLS